MVDNQVQTKAKLTQRDHCVIRYLRFCGYTQANIARKLNIGPYALAACIRQNRLDAPVGELEAVRLEMQAAYRETNRRLSQDDISDAEHIRLCGAQVKQGLAIARILPSDGHMEDETMSRKSEAARQRILSMSDEEAMDELRRMAGLENKSTESGNISPARRSEPDIAEPVSDQGAPGSKAAAGDELADMDVHGRTRSGENKGGR